MASDARNVTLKRGKGGKFISSSQFLKRKQLSENVHVNNAQSRVLQHESSVSNVSPQSSWCEGRRVVELGVLAEGLKACYLRFLCFSVCRTPV